MGDVVEEEDEEDLHALLRKASHHHSPGKNKRKRNLTENLGVLGTWSVFGGFFLAAIIIIFYLFLWGGAGGKSRRGGEEGCPWPRWHKYSVLRASNGGAVSVMHALWDSLWFWGGDQRRSSLSTLPALLITLLLLASSSTQVIPTLLVGDLGLANVVGYSKNTEDVYVGPYKDPQVFNFSNTVGVPMWDSPSWYANLDFGAMPQTYPVFAEDDEQVLDPEPGDDGLSDTGITKRAMLPFLTTEERTSLREYEGPAAVIQSQVTCFPPPITEGTFFKHQNGFFEGSVDISGVPASLPQFDSNDACYVDDEFHWPCPHIPIACSISQDWITTTDGTFSCRFSFGWLEETVRLKLNLLQMVYRVENITRDLSVALSVDPYFDQNAVKIDLGTAEQSDDGGWRTWHLESGLELSASLCFPSYAWNITDVHISGTGSLKEHPVTWNRNDNTVQTRNTRAQMGAVAVQREELDPAPNPDLPRGESRALKLLREGPIVDPKYALNFTVELVYLLRMGVWALYSDQLINTTMPMRFGEPITYLNDSESSKLSWGGQTTSTLHPVYISLFLDVLEDTNRPALAVQLIHDLLLYNLYYARLQYSDFAQEATTVVFTKLVQIPVRWTDLIVTILVLTLKVGCIIAILVLFQKRSNVSTQGNFWQAVAQLGVGGGGGELAWILEKASDMTDDEVTELLKNRGLDGEVVGITSSMELGSIQVKRRSKGRDHIETSSTLSSHAVSLE